MTVIAATLVYNTPTLVLSMWEQIPSILIVDNGSQPPVGSFPTGNIIRREENGLFTKGWNFAMRSLDADWVWMLNSDVVGVNTNQLYAMIGDAPENCACITPSFNSPHGLFYRQGSSIREVGWMDWCCPVVRMDAWKQVGEFDEQFVGYGADLDWCHRARQLGWRFYVDDRWNIIHLGSKTAIQHGLQGQQGNTAEMDHLLVKKWGKHWYELARP